MPVGDEEIAVAVVVIIDKNGAPSDITTIRAGDFFLVRDGQIGARSGATGPRGPVR